MKKILFILILATAFISITQTEASLAERNVQNKQKTNEVQIKDNEVLKGIDLSKSEIPIQPEKLKSEEEISKISQNSTASKKEMTSCERKERLFGLLLLAHGGQR